MCSAHERNEPFGGTDRTAFPVGAGMFGHPFGQQGLAFFIRHIVHELEGGASDLGNADADMDKVVVPSRASLPALRLPDGKHDAETFDICVAHAHVADELAARTFKKMQVFRIIKITHGVRFTIGDAVGEPNIGSGKIVHVQHPWLRVGRGMAIATVLAALLAGCAVGAPLLDDAEEPASVSFYTEEPQARADMLASTLTPPSAQGLRSWEALGPAVRAGLKYAQAREAGQVAVAHGDLAITWGDVADTLVLLEALLPRLDAEPELLAQRFRWVRLTEGASFSGYYEPVVMASRTRKAGYVQPLYGLPSDLRQLDLGRFQPMLTGQRLAYRMSGGEPVPYYARAEIDGEAGVLRGRGLELAWVDPVDAYFLQVQGSGRLRFEDGSEKALLYAGTNGRPYLSIGQYLSGLGIIPPDAVSMQSIRKWLHEHPEERENVLYRNQRYVFFRKAEPASGPVGSMGVPITPFVTLAVDRETFPFGALLAFDVRLPDPSAPLSSSGVVEAFSDLRGLGVAQDTGEAIRGRRIDLFCGKGERAAFIAGHLNRRGEVWMLLAR